jgi:VanZ family protein
MTSLRRNPWAWALLGWIGLIFFSSTSFAGDEGERAFTHLCQILMPQLHSGAGPYGAAHFLAHKTIHISLFSVLGILFWKVLPNVRRKIAIILLLGAVVGSCSELLQAFFPERDPAISDVLINIGGTALGITISMGLVRIQAHIRRACKAEVGQT